MRKIHGPDVDWRNAPLDVNAAYVAGGGIPHGRYVVIMIVCVSLVSIHDNFFFVGWHWATGLWSIVGDGRVPLPVVVVSPLPPAGTMG